MTPGLSPQANQKRGCCVVFPVGRRLKACIYAFYCLDPAHGWACSTKAGQVKGGDTRYLRRSALFDALIDQYALPELATENEKVAISSTGMLEMSARASRIARYQLSRFCQWVEISPNRSRFRLTPTSLKEAQAQGLLTRHLLTLMRKYGKPNPILTQAVLRWEEQGQEAWLDRPLVLHLANPDLLKTLRDSPANKFLGEALGSTAVVVKPGGEAKVQGELVRLGILADGLEAADA